MMITLALKTGLPMGELLALEWGDVDLVTGRLVVRRSNWRGQVGSPKNGRTREIPLSEETIHRLSNFALTQPEAAQLVFCGANGKALAYEAGRDPLRKTCRRAGLREIGWHTLRHYADRWIMPTRFVAQRYLLSEVRSAAALSDAVGLSVSGVRKRLRTLKARVADLPIEGDFE